MMSSPSYSPIGSYELKARASTSIKPLTKDEKLKMAWQLLEEAIEEKPTNNSDFEPILREIHDRIKAVESITKNLSIPQNVKNELEEIRNRLTTRE